MVLLDSETNIQPTGITIRPYETIYLTFRIDSESDQKTSEGNIILETDSNFESIHFNYSF